MLDGSLTAKTNRHNLCALVRTWHDVGHTPAAEGDRKHRKGGDDGWNQGRGTRAGVSVSTVSYVLSGKRAISEKTAAKVRDAIRELQYTPDASAQKMRGIRNRILAVSEPIRGDINEAKYNAYFLHTARQARNAGYDVLLLSGEDAVDDIRRVTRSNMVDGVLLLDIVEDDERVAEAGSYGKPCVAIGYPSRKGDCACVDIDFPAAADLAVRYLHGKGHRDVILLRDNERDYERQSGYVLTLRRLMLERAGEMGMRVTESAKNEFGRFDARASWTAPEVASPPHRDHQPGRCRYAQHGDPRT